MTELKFIGYCPFYKTGRIEVHRLPVYSISSLGTGWMENCVIDNIDPIITYGYFSESVINYLVNYAGYPADINLENSIWSDDSGYSLAIRNYVANPSNVTAWVICNNGSFVEWYGTISLPRQNNPHRFFIIEYNGSYFPGLTYTTDSTKVFSSNFDPLDKYAMVTSLNILDIPSKAVTTLNSKTSMFLGWLIGKRLAGQGERLKTEILEMNTLTAGVVIDTATVHLYDDSSDVPSGIASEELLGTDGPTVKLVGNHLIVEAYVNE